ncbi:MAG: hypothetical protein KKF44_02105 [Nanoarchaeota archaeon]|nr:hypothetical protein [Nanoarchaeota archaeon]
MRYASILTILFLIFLIACSTPAASPEQSDVVPPESTVETDVQQPENPGHYIEDLNDIEFDHRLNVENTGSTPTASYKNPYETQNEGCVHFYGGELYDPARHPPLVEGENLKLHIIVTPCNYLTKELTGEDREGKFEEDVKMFAEFLATVKPFNENTHKYRITSLWNTDKSDGGPSTIDNERYDLCYIYGDGVFDEEAKSVVISQPCVENSYNTIYIQFINRHTTRGASGVGAKFKKENHPEITSGPNIISFINMKIGYKHNQKVLLHELGHELHFGHTNWFGYSNDPEQTKSSYQYDSETHNNLIFPYFDFYIPEIPDDLHDDFPKGTVCPLWENTVGGQCELLDGTLYDMQCQNHYSDWKNRYSPCEKDVMGYGYRDNDLRFNPVQVSMVRDMFNLGYYAYTQKKYPHTCTELDDLQNMISCIKKECAIIPKNHVDPSYFNKMPTEGLVLSDQNDMGNSRIACCTRIPREYLNEREDCMNPSHASTDNLVTT